MADTLHPPPSPELSRSEPIPTRGTVSCERCKRRKSRCDRRQPTCQRCASAQVLCQYVSRRKPGFPMGYRQILEAKIKTLEEEMQMLREGDNPAPARERDALDGTESRASFTPGTLVEAEDPAMEQPLGATSSRTGKILEQKPPADLVCSLVSLFFRHVHQWLPFLDVQCVFDDMRSKDDPPLLHYALFGISLPYSFDSRLNTNSSDSFWKYSKRRIFVEILEEPSYTSLQALTILLLDISGMTNGPQIWGTLAVATRLAVQLRPVGGRVLRTSTEEVANNLPCRPDQIARLRLFWAIYAIDCYITITTGHPSALTDFDLQHFLSTREVVWSDQKDSSQLAYSRSIPMQPREQKREASSITPTFVFKHQLELLHVSRELHSVYIQYITLFRGDESRISHWSQSFIASSANLTSWFRALPWCLRLETPDQLQRLNAGALAPVVLLNVFYHALTIHLNGLAAFPNDQALQSQLSGSHQDYQDSCRESVQSLVDISSAAMQKAKDKLGWPFSWCLWVAARYLIVARYNGVGDFFHHFEILKQYLKQMGRFWQISRKYWLLARQAETELERTMAGDTSSSRLLASVLDLCTPTSDLEDQARIDPFLLNAPVVGEGDDPTSGYGDMMGDAPFSGRPRFNAMSFDNFSAQNPADDWFSTPLLAFSAYEQSLTGLVENSTEFNILDQSTVL